MKRIFLILSFFLLSLKSFCWGFFAHKKINHYAVFLLPPEMMVLYKSNIAFLTDHATDADKRKGMIKNEGGKHFIDIDHYGSYPYKDLPRRWKEAVQVYTEDTLKKYGIVPWAIENVLFNLTNSFKEKDLKKILKYSADLGHYVGDAHVPLHTNTNHNGQLTDQVGIHGFWESRIPELLADKEFNFYIGGAQYISNTHQYIWDRILESAAAADSVLFLEKELSSQFSSFTKYSYEKRNKKLVKQYSSSYTKAYHLKLNKMVERRMQQAIFTLASFWLTAWVNAGQPDLKDLSLKKLTPEEQKEFEKLDSSWKKNNFGGTDICQ